MDKFHQDLIEFVEDECHAMEAAAERHPAKVIRFFRNTYHTRDVASLLDIFVNSVNIKFLSEPAILDVFIILSRFELKYLEKRAPLEILPCGCPRETHKKLIESILNKLKQPGPIN